MTTLSDCEIFKREHKRVITVGKTTIQSDDSAQDKIGESTR